MLLEVHRKTAYSLIKKLLGLTEYISSFICREKINYPDKTADKFLYREYPDKLA